MNRKSTAETSSVTQNESFRQLIFGMYVHEYGLDAPPRYASRAYIECIDSPPVRPRPSSFKFPVSYV